MYRVATDIGGTYTDVAYCEHDPDLGTAGPVRSWKTDSVPDDLTAGVAAAIGAAGLRSQEIAFFAHGSTVVINALTERKGAKTGLITTAGFRDVLEIARGNRPDLFNFRFRKPAPFVPRHLRLEVDERTDYCGQVLRRVDAKGLAACVDTLRGEGVAAIAVSFLHAYANPANEAEAVAWIRERWPEVPVVASHESSREWREYERTNTAVLSAYVAPVVDRYLQSLERRLGDGGMNRPPFIMQSNGGIVTVGAARRNPVALAESGPAAGVLGAVALAQAVGHDNVIALDIGGTTAKCSLIEGGRPTVTTDYYIEATRRSPGYPIKTPVVDIVEIGTGGGSIAALDAGGKLHVGPESAGAHPGPVAYGHGGDAPTLTDAHVLSGRIDAARVLGRDGAVDIVPVRAAYAKLGERVGVSAEAMAQGVLRLAEVNMVSALKLISINRGHDPRDFTLIAYGGGGPLHASMLAAALHIPEVLVPPNAPVFSAWGMLLCDIRRDYIRTHVSRLDTAAVDGLAAIVAELEAQARADFAADELPENQPLFERAADMRYHGQEHTVKVNLPGGAIDAAATDVWQARFRDAYDRLYRVRLDLPVEVVNAHLIAFGSIAKPTLTKRAGNGTDPTAARMGSRGVDFGEAGQHDVAVFDRARLTPGMVLAGPALVEEMGTVTAICPGQTARIDCYDNIVIQTGA
jgi:N-methylhydantoinase A